MRSELTETVAAGIGALEVRTSTNIDGEALVRVRGPSAASDKAAELAGRKAKKKMRAEGIALFNAKPKKGLAQLQAQGLLSQDPADVAHFLRQTEGLDFAAVGEVLSDPADDCKAVRPGLSCTIMLLTLMRWKLRRWPGCHG